MKCRFWHLKGARENANTKIIMEQTPAEPINTNMFIFIAFECLSQFNQFANVVRGVGSAIGSKESLHISFILICFGGKFGNRKRVLSWCIGNHLRHANAVPKLYLPSAQRSQAYRQSFSDSMQLCPRLAESERRICHSSKLITRLLIDTAQYRC